YADIFLPDFKYWGDGAANRYSNAAGYADVAKKAIAQMAEQAGPPVFNADGILQRGVVVRHMLLPGYAEDSKAIIRWLHEKLGDSVLLSIMSQYTPMPGLERFPELERTVTETEYDDLVDYALTIGLEDAYIQEGGAASESFIPPFDCEGV
ncbi:MAG: radical SAM protein, partial [Eubacteriales bacterium]